MWPTPRAESIREPHKVLFVDGVEHLDDGALDDLILQHGDSERPLPPVRLLDVRPPYRLGSVRSPLKSLRESPKVLFQLFAVVLPRLAVDPCRRLSLEREVGLPQPLDGAHVVQERGESQLLVFPCCSSYPLERAGHTFPALRPARVALKRVPLGHLPSLRRLRRWSRSVVRQLLRYYEGVRLPVTVHHRLWSLDSPMRSGPRLLPDGGGISRFPCKVFPCMRRVFDRARSPLLLRWRGA